MFCNLYSLGNRLGYPFQLSLLNWPQIVYPGNIRFKSVIDFSAKGSGSRVLATNRDCLLTSWWDCPKYGSVPAMRKMRGGEVGHWGQCLAVNPGSTTHGLKRPSPCLLKLQSPPHLFCTGPSWGFSELIFVNLLEQLTLRCFLVLLLLLTVLLQNSVTRCFHL